MRIAQKYQLDTRAHLGLVWDDLTAARPATLFCGQYHCASHRVSVQRRLFLSPRLVQEGE
ncbi:MAG TPA: hypothetical protein VMB23_10860 [Spirochaetia bacterium]|jgi:hypothetical protein|nr:hypothetical protein [Spirochaetia bacterium]